MSRSDNGDDASSDTAISRNTSRGGRAEDPTLWSVLVRTLDAEADLLDRLAREFDHHVSFLT
ncbi:MAG: hypothetical protein WBD74_02835 [Candidatus Aquilonibacter sp.]